MKKFLIVAQLFLFIELYAVTINFDYSPGSILITNKKDSGSINVKDKVGPADKMGDIYFSRLSLSLYTDPIKFDSPENEKNYVMILWGPFLTVMHDYVILYPADMEYFENEGRAHIITGVLGLSLKALMSYGFFTEYGLGITRTSILKDEFSKRSTGKNTDYTFKFGFGYSFKMTDYTSVNFGVDMMAPVNSYHKTNSGEYVHFRHGGIYPYVGISF